MSIKKRSRIGDGEKKIAKLAYIYIFLVGGLGLDTLRHVGSSRVRD